MHTGELAPASNRADWLVTVEDLSDPVTGVLIDLTGAEIKLAVRNRPRENSVLSATEIDGHITLGALGSFTFHFTPVEMATVCAGQYDVGMTVKLAPIPPADGVTHQLFIGTVNVLDGVVDP